MASPQAWSSRGSAAASATPAAIPTLLGRVFTSNPARVQRHRHIEGLSRLTGAVIETRDARPLPVQVDGDHVGEWERVELSVEPRGLAVVS